MTNRISPSLWLDLSGDDAFAFDIVVFIFMPATRHSVTPKARSGLLFLGCFGVVFVQLVRINPAQHDACGHDHGLRFFQRHIEGFQHAVILDTFTVDGGQATGQLPIRASGEIFQRLDAVLAQSFEHLRCQTFEINQALFDAGCNRGIHRLFRLRL